MTAAGKKTSHNGYAKWYVWHAKTLRVKAGMTINKLAAHAEVGRQSVSNVESHNAVSEVVAQKIFDALNQRHGNSLDRDSFVKDMPFRVGSPFPL